MSKYTMAGLTSWLFSGLILLFQAISSVMGNEEKFAFKSLSLVSVVGQDHFKWIDSISWDGIQNLVSFLVTMPLFILLFCIGILFFLIHMATNRL
ncbi:MAG: hypothetical protein SRB2_04620 [Desulfobacteraceae bacterium Eth-SRB2]|nr:MAG: hypothetical protein SRB2_04620 [Desulfobacteraceae bacterium Eth-SRB2]